MTEAGLQDRTAEAELISRLRAGDERAFETLVERDYPTMLAVARHYVKSRAVAEEVVQEAWLGVLWTPTTPSAPDRLTGLPPSSGSCNARAASETHWGGPRSHLPRARRTRHRLPRRRADADRARFEGHVAASEGCDRYVEQIRTTVDPTSEIHVLEERPEVSFRDYRRRP